jgi:hypothetical protein
MVYATSLQTMVFCAADPKKYQVRITENARWLERVQKNDGPRRGMWAYSDRQGGGDNSNTQFAMLALFEAERVGVKIDPKVWRASLDYWSRTQRADGSWGYTAEEPASGSMTCAGVASLVIAAGRLGFVDASVTDDNVHCCGSSDAADDAASRIERGLMWLGKHFQVDANPSAAGLGESGGRTWLYYYLYGVERVGRLTGRRYFVGQKKVAGRDVTPRLVSRRGLLSGRPTRSSATLLERRRAGRIERPGVDVVGALVLVKRASPDCARQNAPRRRSGLGRASAGSAQPDAPFGTSLETRSGLANGRLERVDRRLVAVACAGAERP